MKLKNTIIAGGLAALTLGACIEYTRARAGIYNCQKYGGAITARTHDVEAEKSSENIFGWKNISYRNMSLEEAIKALDACENALKTKAEKEQ